jgi:hypothetical protein
MTVRFSVTSADELVIADGRGVRWRGRPDGYPVVCVVPLPEAPDAIVLLDYSAEGAPSRFANILRVDPDGHIAWRAAPPAIEDVASDLAEWITEGADDAWVAVRWGKRGDLFANSWSCFACELDPTSGRITSAIFTK